MQELNQIKLPKWHYRFRHSHKGNYGRVLIIGGSPGMTGSVHLATQAALRSGSGLVYLLAPENIRTILEIKSIETIIRQEGLKAFDGSERVFHSLTEASYKMDALAIGPGLISEQPTGFLKQFERWLTMVEVPLVIDAGLLRLLSTNPSILSYTREAVITPHEMEMARLTQLPLGEIQTNRLKIAQQVATTYHVLVVLKGHQTIVTDGRLTYINQTGNPGMATAGSGDVLTGMVTSLIGQGYSLFEATQLAVYLHGLSGDLAKAELGEPGLIASDLIRFIPLAIKTYQAHR